MFLFRFTRRQKMKAVAYQLEQIISEQILITARINALMAKFKLGRFGK